MKEKDINITIGDTLLNIRAVAVITYDNKILFQKRKQDKYWALPGGKVRIGEPTKDTIKRELKEELELSNFSIGKCNSVSEYFFTFDNIPIHQYIFSYIVYVNGDEWILKEKGELEGKEQNENLIFKWFDLNSLKIAPIKPNFLKEQLTNINNENIIFTSFSE